MHARREFPSSACRTRPWVPSEVAGHPSWPSSGRRTLHSSPRLFRHSSMDITLSPTVAARRVNGAAGTVESSDQRFGSKGARSPKPFETSQLRGQSRVGAGERYLESTTEIRDLTPCRASLRRFCSCLSLPINFDLPIQDVHYIFYFNGHVVLHFFARASFKR